VIDPVSNLTHILELVSQAFEIVGVAVLALGGLAVGVHAAREALARRPVYEYSRRSLGRVLLLGLEVLVAADIVLTVSTDLTMESIAILGLLVVVRTILSFALAAELDGVSPWRRTELHARLAAAAKDGAPGPAEPTGTLPER
jgi:uncharacterized membrane protein